MEQAVITAETLKKKVAQEAIIVSDFLIDITISIGCAAYENDDNNVEAIIQRADQALYDAKKQGRNRVCFLPDQSK